mmetsp:Transcript_29598/g.90802  ORF Transcript_29598/g.90802 Transcript_29598/m.90802 type:complete len:270 (-) Transcript_29598:850-1659(-)
MKIVVKRVSDRATTYRATITMDSMDDTNDFIREHMAIVTPYQGRSSLPRAASIVLMVLTFGTHHGCIPLLQSTLRGDALCIRRRPALPCLCLRWLRHYRAHWRVWEDSDPRCPSAHLLPALQLMPYEQPVSFSGECVYTSLQLLDHCPKRRRQLLLHIRSLLSARLQFYLELLDHGVALSLTRIAAENPILSREVVYALAQVLHLRIGLFQPVVQLSNLFLHVICLCCRAYLLLLIGPHPLDRRVARRGHLRPCPSVHRCVSNSTLWRC